MLEKNKQNMHTVMEDGLNQLADKLNIAEQGQEQKTSELNAYADKISAHLVMLDANGKWENDELHQRLDTELSALGVKFSDQLSDALTMLTQASNELNSSKTDRKTLAKLLATVVSNLETGDDE